MTIISFHYKYIFIANPKTGSTSIHDVLSSKFTKPGDIVAKKSVHEKPIGKHDSVQKVHDFLKARGIRMEDFFVFSFRREPCARMVSCYNYEFHNKWYRPILNPLLVDFKDHYLMYPSKIMHMASYQNLFTIQGEQPSFLHLFKIEELAPFCQMLREKTNISLSPNVVPRANQSPKTIQPKIPDLIAELPPDVVKRLQTAFPNDLDAYYDISPDFKLTPRICQFKDE